MKTETIEKVCALVTFLVLSINILVFSVHSGTSQPIRVIVPDQYSTIQAAIDHADYGDTVFVRSGIYHEHVVINKTVSLVGEDDDTVIIDGSFVGIVVVITHDGVSISNFTIEASGTSWNIGGPPYGAGVYASNVTNCTIVGNRFIQDAVGIQLEFGADGNVIANNTITDVSLGFGTFDASWNTFRGNNVTSNDRGLGLNVNSDYNLLSDNIVIASEWVFALHECHCNNITSNYVANGQIGIYLPASSGNRVYHNTIVNNLLQASTTSGGFTSLSNYWDNGYPSGGNYWSDYQGNDSYQGSGQNMTGRDMKGDSSYDVDSVNIDNYPLMKPICILIRGDMNLDGRVNSQDLYLLSSSYGSKPGYSNWNPNADIDDNGIVDLPDLVILALHYGQHYP